jgi:hypothetical protein
METDCKVCTNCKEHKPATEFWKQKSTPDGLQAWCKGCSKSWATKNRDKRQLYEKRWREKYPERYRDSYRKSNAKSRLEHPERDMVVHARHRAKKKGIAFSLSPEDIVIPKHCPIFGVELELGKGRVGRNSPSLDRIDPNRGYTPDNVWVISYRANVIKNDAAPEELIHIGAVLSHLYPDLTTDATTQIKNKPSQETI